MVSEMVNQDSEQKPLTICGSSSAIDHLENLESGTGDGDVRLSLSGSPSSSPMPDTLARIRSVVNFVRLEVRRQRERSDEKLAG